VYKKKNFQTEIITKKFCKRTTELSLILTMNFLKVSLAFIGLFVIAENVAQVFICMLKSKLYSLNGYLKKPFELKFPSQAVDQFSSGNIN